MERPKFTIVYNSQSEDGFVGVCWEFFTNEHKAQARYDQLASSPEQYCPTKRPYYHETDRHHLGAGHWELRNSPSDKWIKLNKEFEKALEKFDEWTPKDRTPIEAFEHEQKIGKLAIEYSKVVMLESMDENSKKMCQRDFGAGFLKCEELQYNCYTKLINDYEEVIEDHKRLVREIDVILCGKDAAQQASLCDLVSPIRELKEQVSNMQEKVWDELKRKTVDTEKYGAVIPIQTLVRVLFKTQITKENENNFNATTVSKLRNQLSPYYSLPSMILAMDEHPDLKPLLIEQAKQAISTQDKIKELLTEIENESK